MYRRFMVAMLASLLLAACGRGSEDFTVNVARPADKVAAAFGHAGIDDEFGSMFPGLRVKRTEPASGQVLYTLPGNSEFEAAIRFDFESSDDGKATIVHVSIDVPKTTVDLEGKSMVVSERKVEAMVRDLLRSAAKKLEDGRGIESEQRDFSRVLTVLAIITDSKTLRMAKDMATHPEWYMAGLGWLSDEGSASPYGDLAIPEDPGTAARMDEYKQQSAERQEQAKAEEAAEPIDDARGDSAQGDYSGGSDY